MKDVNPSGDGARVTAIEEEIKERKVQTQALFQSSELEAMRSNQIESDAFRSKDNHCGS